MCACVCVLCMFVCYHSYCMYSHANKTILRRRDEAFVCEFGKDGMRVLGRGGDVP